ncbi:topoisomerase II-associated protein PAT1 [Cryomyces antarcticus]
MSFFDFGPALPQERAGGHNPSAPGFGHAPDPFAFARKEDGGDDDVLDFEDTYDGLGAQLDEAGDAFNDDTFGAEQREVGKDFDFSGQTAKVADVFQQEQMLHHPGQQLPSSNLPKPATRPSRSGYENYAEPEYIPQLEASASIWGLPQKRQAAERPQPQGQQSYGAAAASSRKMMSLEEVEAAMRAQSRKPTTPQPPPHTHQLSAPPSIIDMAPKPGVPLQQGYTGPPRDSQRPQLPPEQRHSGTRQPPPPEAVGLLWPGAVEQGPQLLQRQQPVSPQVAQRAGSAQLPPYQPFPQPTRILRNPNRLSGQEQLVTPPMKPHLERSGQPRMSTPQATGPAHNREQTRQGPPITHADQAMQLSEEDRAAFLAEEAKRAKRNHKIYMLSKDNGLMTPQDKNFITRIQLQQLLTATGNVDDQGPEATLAEDFYYQVFSQIRGASTQTPHQPLSQFAQTYLFQTAGRQGMNRRGFRGTGNNHMQRMEQQVARAVEAAKLKPKNRQLIIEGSLGKISFSNAKTPKPLLNLKRQESGDIKPHTPRKAGVTIADRKVTLRNVETVYSILMRMEDHERHLPPPPTEESAPEEIQQHMEWRQQVLRANQQLWRALKVMEPIVPNSPTPHPFIAILSTPKGKKVILRLFRHLDDQQRVTILTMIVVQLDTLDVIRAPVAHEVDLFSNAVMPALFGYVADAPLNIVIGLLGLVVDRVNVQMIVRTRVGVGILTMLISRAELSKQGVSEAERHQWNILFNQLFDLVEPMLPHLFTGGESKTTEGKSPHDVHIWQFLAAVGVGSTPEQQQRLVLGVKDKVMETVGLGRRSGGEEGEKRLAEVNLFMRAIGLDVGLLG